MLNLNQLEVFVKAAEACSFSAAGRRLHMTQPAVSLQIRDLERRLRLELFHRNGPSVTLTEAGQALLPMARSLIREAQRLEETVASMQGDLVGELVIACTTTSGKYVLPHLIAGFRRRHPRVIPRVLVLCQGTALDQVDWGTAHFACTSSLVEHRDLEYQSFFTDRIVLIAPPEHPWAQRGRIGVEELVGADFLLREESSGTRKIMVESLAKHGIRLEDLNVVMELGNAEAIETSVESGIGVSFVSELVAAKGIALGRVCEVEVEGLYLSRQLYVARSLRHPLTRVQAAFRDFLAAPGSQMLLRKVEVAPSAALTGD